MKKCPRCGSANPDTSAVCDCGHSFQTDEAVCPNCHRAEGFQVLGLADEGKRMAAGLIGGRGLTYLLYGRPANMVRCCECGHVFRYAGPRRKWTKADYIGIAIGLIIVITVAVLGIIVESKSK